MWDHFRDPGYMQTAKVLSEDIKCLKQMRLNGLVSCQVQRAFFPTGLGICLMARTLWNKDINFTDEVNRYFNLAFGADWQQARDYLSSLTDAFDPVYLRHEKLITKAQNKAQYLFVLIIQSLPESYKYFLSITLFSFILLGQFLFLQFWNSSIGILVLWVCPCLLATDT